MYLSLLIALFVMAALLDVARGMTFLRDRVSLLLRGTTLGPFMGVTKCQGGREPSPVLEHVYTYQKDGPKKFSGSMSYIYDGFHDPIGLHSTKQAYIYERHHPSRWSIRGTLTQEDGLIWIDEFVAWHADPDVGLVWGTYDKIVYSETEEAFLDFLAHHPGTGWEGP